MKTEKIKVKFALNLVDMFDPQKGSDFISKIKDLRKKLKETSGFELPDVRISDTSELKDNKYSIIINDKKSL